MSKAAELLGPVLAFSNQTAFAGREAEISRLNKVVEGAANGEGSLVMIGGGPGVGKTRLALEVAKYARSGVSDSSWHGVMRASSAAHICPVRGDN